MPYSRMFSCRRYNEQFDGKKETETGHAILSISRSHVTSCNFYTGYNGYKHKLQEATPRHQQLHVREHLAKRMSQLCMFALFPARMRDISNPRLNASLNRSRDWKVETNGNHDNTAMGTKIIMPVPASYMRDTSRTQSHNPKLLTNLFHVKVMQVSTSHQKSNLKLHNAQSKSIGQ